MKKIIYQFSISLLLSMIFVMLIEMPAITGAELGLYLDRHEVLFLYIAMSVFGLCCSPFRKNCCTGDLMELLFNLVPIECLAQYHSWIAVILVMIMIGILGSFIWTIYRKEGQHKFSEKNDAGISVVYKEVLS